MQKPLLKTSFMINMLTRQSHSYFAYIHIVQTDPAYFILKWLLVLLIQFSEYQLMEYFLGHLQLYKVRGGGEENYWNPVISHGIYPNLIRIHSLHPLFLVFTVLEFFYWFQCFSALIWAFFCSSMTWCVVFLAQRRWNRPIRLCSVVRDLNGIDLLNWNQMTPFNSILPTQPASPTL